MSTPEERLAELGPDRARGGQAGGGVHPGRAQRQPRLHLRPAADARRPADRHRQGRRRGHRGGGRRVRAAVRAQRARRGARPRSASCRRSSGSSRSSCSSPRRPTSPASRRSPTAPPSCSARSSATPAGTPARAVGVAGAAARRARSRSSSSSRSERVDPRSRLPPDSWSSRRARVRRRQPRRRSSRATPRPWCCCGRRGSRRARGLPAAPAGLDGVRRRACACSPAAASTRATSTHDGRLGRARARPSGPRGSAPTRRRRGRWSAPRCARRSRSPACCWPGRPRTTVVADTTGDDWEADRRRARGARARRSPTFLDRRGLVLRTDLLRRLGARWLTPVFEPRRYRTWFFVAALPDGPASPATSPPSPTTVIWLPVARGGRARSTRSEMLMLPPTYLHLPGGRRSTPTPPTCSPRPRGRDRSRCSRRRSRSTSDGADALDPRPAARLAGGRRRGCADEPGPGGSFGERARCVLAPERRT